MTPRINQEWIDQVLIVDAGSTDGTIEWSRKNGYEVYVQQRSGIRRGFTDALPRIKGDIVITLSPDGNCIPELIPKLIDKMNQDFDMVIASRYMGTAHSEDDTFLSKIGNWFFTKSINILHGGNYTDAMGIFRAYRKQLIYDLELDQEKWYTTPEALFCVEPVGWETLLSLRMASRKLQITEIEGDEPARLDGNSRIFPNLFVQIRWAAVYYFQIIRDIFFWR